MQKHCQSHFFLNRTYTQICVDTSFTKFQVAEMFAVVLFVVMKIASGMLMNKFQKKHASSSDLISRDYFQKKIIPVRDLKTQSR
jgi:hypothetical protein